MKEWITAAIAAALACAPAYAQQESGESPAAETIRWPIPWKVGQVLTYETENLDMENSPKKREKIRSTDRTTIAITEATLEGYVQRWTSAEPRYEVIEGDAEAAKLAEDLVKALANLPIMVELDKDATYKGIRNLAEISSRVRAEMEPLVAKGVEHGVRKVNKDASDADVKAAMEKARPHLDGMLEGLTSPAFLEAAIGQVVQNYNGFVGIELEAGAKYSAETELDNPLGASKFPATIEFGLYASEDDPDDVFLEWTSTIDPVRGADAVWEAAEALMGTKIPSQERKTLPEEVSIIDEGFVLFNRSSGVIEMYENERKTILGDTHKTDRDRMRLVGGEHDHAWHGDGEPASGEAAAEAEPGAG